MNRVRLLRNDIAQATGGDHVRRPAEFMFDPFDERVDEAGISKEEAGLDAGSGVCPDHRFGPRQLDFGQFVSAVTGGAGNAEGSVANSAITGEETEGRQHIWWSLLLIALLLLVAESIVARRTKVARMVG